MAAKLKNLLAEQHQLLLKGIGTSGRAQEPASPTRTLPAAQQRSRSFVPRNHRLATLTVSLSADSPLDGYLAAITVITASLELASSTSEERKAERIRQLMLSVANRVALTDIFIVSPKSFRERSLKMCPEIRPDHILSEPLMRGTAVTTALAVLLGRRHGGNEAVVTLLPAEPLTDNEAAFHNSLSTAVYTAQYNDVVVLLGAQPRRHASGRHLTYGQLFACHHQTGISAYAIDGCVASPTPEEARRLLAAGNCLCDLGVVVARASVLARALAETVPDIWSPLVALEKRWHEGGTLEALLWETYYHLPEAPLEHAVLDRLSNVVVVECPFEWQQ